MASGATDIATHLRHSCDAIPPLTEQAPYKGQGWLMARSEPPQHHWRSYGTDPLPTPQAVVELTGAAMPTVKLALAIVFSSVASSWKWALRLTGMRPPRVP